MEKLDINLDDDFKNINTNISSNTDSIGIDLLIGGNSSPKSNMSDDVKSVKNVYDLVITDFEQMIKGYPVQ